jgi:uncharacterized membrane protein YfcA
LLIATLFAIGLVAGILGTLVGLGGAFVVIPVLRLFFGISPALTAGIALFMVLANGISASFAYLRQGRADVRIALVTAATGIPSSILGTVLVHRVPAASFDLLYGAMLVYFFIYLLHRRKNATPENVASTPRLRGTRQRVITDAYGETFTYYWSVPLALALGVLIGLASTFFGIGGGIIFTLASLALLRMPIHISAATAMVVMLLTAPVGVASHIVAGDVDWAFAIPLAAGGVIGGQVGPQIARRLSTPQLLTVLAYSLLVAAISLAVRHVIPH